MNDNMKKLVDLASKDKEMSAKLQKASKEQVIALAKEHGIKLTEADFETPQGKVSDDELAAVAGGGICVCVLGGGGKADEGEKTCACVIVGVGCYVGGEVRCSCSSAGGGTD